jgi:hypothetical protein
MEIVVNRIGILGILILMAFVVSGYVASSPHDDALAAEATPHLDPHVSHYEQHLRNLGITVSIPERPANPVHQSAPAREQPRTIFL